MDRLTSLFNSPLFLGFDHFERLIDTMSKVQDNYPPYNIEQIGQYGFRITRLSRFSDRQNLRGFAYIFKSSRVPRPFSLKLKKARRLARPL